jgi:pyrimidine operon attenuation protein/uracil phosphoribosyltransferase
MGRPASDSLSLLLARVATLLRQIATVLEECCLVGWAAQAIALAKELDETIHQLDEVTDHGQR